MPRNTPGRDGAAATSEPAYDTQAREASITGKPPRIPPLKRSEFSDDVLTTLNNLRKAIALPPSDIVPEFTATMLRYPALFERHHALGLHLFKGALAPRDRELAVLRTAWLCQAPFEWGEHVSVGKRVAAMTPEEIERIILGSTAPGWSEHERAMIRAVEELHEDAMISDETWAVLARTLNEQQLIELPLLVGQYQGVAYVQNALRVRLLPANPGLSAR